MTAYPYTLQDALSALESHGCKPKPSGAGYVACCPAHEADGKSHTPSLTVNVGDKVPFVVYCHAGCDPKSVLTALGLNKPRDKSSRKIVAVYPYHDAAGNVVSEKVRYEPKDFRQRWPDGKGGYVWKKPAGAPAVLYRLPALIEGIAAGQDIFFVEGEKDVDRLVLDWLHTTTTIEGASKDIHKQKWRPEYTTQMTGAVRVILLPDNDDAGRAHMANIAKELQGKVGEIRWLELPGLPVKGDVSDWLNAGHTVDELLALAKAAGPAPMPSKGKATPERADAGTVGSDLNPYRGTDDANADLLLALHGADIRYCPPWDKYLIWTGSHWRIDDRLDIERLAADVSRSLRTRAIALTQERQVLLDRMAELMARMNATPGSSVTLGREHTQLRNRQTAIGDEVDWLLKLAGRLEGTAKRNCMLAAVRHKVVVHHSDLDKGHFLLNAGNGTVDLHTGAIRPHERLDLLTHDVEILFDLTATAPTWIAFLHSTFAGDVELIAFVQRAVG